MEKINEREKPMKTVIKLFLMLLYAASFSAVIAHENDAISFIYKENTKSAKECWQMLSDGNSFVDSTDCSEIQARAGAVTSHYLCHKFGDSEYCRNHPKEGRGKNSSSDTGNADPTLSFCKAAKSGNLAEVKRLLVAGANPKAECQGKDTVLMRAADDGHTEVIKALLMAGANPDAQNEFGNTALMLATIDGHLQSVKVLLEAGANPNLMNKKDRTALRFALAFEYLEIAIILQEAGAE